MELENGKNFRLEDGTDGASLSFSFIRNLTSNSTYRVNNVFELAGGRIAVSFSNVDRVFVYNLTQNTTTAANLTFISTSKYYPVSMTQLKGGLFLLSSGQNSYYHMPLGTLQTFNTTTGSQIANVSTNFSLFSVNQLASGLIFGYAQQTGNIYLYNANLTLNRTILLGGAVNSYFQASVFYNNSAQKVAIISNYYRINVYDATTWNLDISLSIVYDSSMHNTNFQLLSVNNGNNTLAVIGDISANPLLVNIIPQRTVTLTTPSSALATLNNGVVVTTSKVANQISLWNSTSGVFLSRTIGGPVNATVICPLTLSMNGFAVGATDGKVSIFKFQ